MGYCMSMRDSKIRIPASKHDRCLAAIRALSGRGTAYYSSGGHYSWVRTHEFANATTLREALAAWRWVDPNQDLTNPDNDKSKDIEELYFSGEKIGDDFILMSAIAPYVEAGSYIEMVGEGAWLGPGADYWRWYFDGEGCIEQAGQVVYTVEDFDRSKERTYTIDEDDKK